MTSSKSQVTIFIILGILLVFIVIVLAQIDLQKISKVAPEISEANNPDSSLESYIQTCLERTTDIGLEWALFEFGQYKEGDVFSTAQVYIVAKDSSDDVENQQVTRTLDFSKENVKTSLQVFFDDAFMNCIRDFSSFREMGREINYSDPVAEISVEDYAVILDVVFPVTETIEEDRRSFERFSYRKGIGMKDIIETTNNFIDESVSLNELPSDLIRNFESERQDINVVMTFLYEGWPQTPYVEWIMIFRESGYRVAFIINYDWYRSDATYKSIDELFDEAEQKTQ